MCECVCLYNLIRVCWIVYDIGSYSRSFAMPEKQVKQSWSKVWTKTRQRRAEGLTISSDANDDDDDDDNDADDDDDVVEGVTKTKLTLAEQHTFTYYIIIQ